MSDTIHIVCLDAPSPPDYGGAIDMFYKIKALHSIGKKIILHYFDYRPNRNADLLKEHYMAIYRYQRKPLWRSLPLLSPFIIGSRQSNELADRLNKDRFPILLEGLHCTGILPLLNDRKRVCVRLHNEEASYYYHLAQTEKNWLKRFYFKQESRLLSGYQKKLEKETHFACLSETDMQVMKEKYGLQRLTFVPCFLPWQEVSSLVGNGEYCLYHGNLSVPENDAAANWLIDEVFSRMTVPLVIAGKGISKKLMQKREDYLHVSFINNPSIEAIDDLVRKAHINVLPSLNNTGVKLKLLNALLNGRFCITNSNGVKGSRIETGVLVKDRPDNWIEAIQNQMAQAFTQQDKDERQNVLALYDNRKAAAELSALWSHCQ